MEKAKPKLFMILIITLFISSCTIYREFPIEVYQPSELQFPDDAKDIVILSHNFKFDQDTFQNYYKRNKKLLRLPENISQSIDSMMVTKVLNSLSKSLKINGSFEDIKLLPYNFIEQSKGEFISTLSKDFIKKLDAHYNTDLVVSLETFSYFYSEYPYGVEKSIAYNQVLTAATWAVYSPDKELLLDIKTMVDTVFWDGSTTDKKRGRIRKPPIAEALQTAAQVAGENYARRLSPGWQNVYRMYVIPPVEDFKDAARHFEQEKLDKAIALWDKYNGQRFGKLSIWANYNIALAKELQGNIDAAKQAIEKSLLQAIALKNSEDIKTVSLYNSVLQKRVYDISILSEKENNLDKFFEGFQE